ncbi:MULTISPECIES: hypothetical protein [Paenibacillus]|uniref:Uncharacterized protein n=1 Tax=Paenibacillus lactis TaxID=228574 RepID=A0ABS4FBI4_9BACL|nr:hypothetical protein [Paenibacillus lactis]MBP1893615.1 hypothetical protein [Paenibacillus lactis]MCM3491990.1 hypothetical protein [Paenibacillus lactis]
MNDYDLIERRFVVQLADPSVCLVKASLVFMRFFVRVLTLELVHDRLNISGTGAPST